jgi:DNA repair exonuclease SbcCD ATPase subunit
MGKTHEALKKAETEFLKKFGENNHRQEARKPGRLKPPYVGLIILGLLMLIIAGYVYGRRDGKSTAADVKVLQSAQTHIAQLDNELVLKKHKLDELKKQLHESQKAIQELQKARESQRAELLTNKAMVKTLQEQLTTAQSYQIDLKDEVTNSKQLINALRAQLIALKNKIGTTATASPLVQAPKKPPEMAPSFDLQKDVEADKFDQPATVQDLSSLSETDDMVLNGKAASTAGNDPSTTDPQSPDPALLIDWLLKKQSE